jgi:hypothetical protein
MMAHFCRPQVEAALGHKFSLTPYFSIIIGVTLSVLLCLLLSFVKRGMRNRRLRCAVLLTLPTPRSGRNAVPSHSDQHPVAAESAPASTHGTQL